MKVFSEKAAANEISAHGALGDQHMDFEEKHDCHLDQEVLLLYFSVKVTLLFFLVFWLDTYGSKFNHAGDLWLNFFLPLFVVWPLDMFTQSFTWVKNDGSD